MSSSTKRIGAHLTLAALMIVLPLTLTAQMPSDSAPQIARALPMEAALTSSSSAPGDHRELSALPAGPSIGSHEAFPPSPALIAPVRNESKNALETRPTLPKKTFYSLALLNHSAVAFDSWSTRNLVENGGHELNPLLKPFAHSNGLYAVMQTWPTAIDYFGAKMARSNKPWMRKMWWLPQTASAASSIAIGLRNVSLANSSQKLVK